MKATLREAGGKLAGRVAVISGAALGIVGCAIAEQFQGDGARVVLLDCCRAALESWTRFRMNFVHDSSTSVYVPCAAGLHGRRRNWL